MLMGRSETRANRKNRLHPLPDLLSSVTCFVVSPAVKRVILGAARGAVQRARGSGCRAPANSLLIPFRPDSPPEELWNDTL